MVRPTWLTALLGIGLCTCFLGTAAAQDDIQRDFRTPPEAARPMTWWHWMNGNVTKEGITADLEAMKRIGLGGAQIFNVAQGEPLGPVKFMSPEWRALTKHAITEANRLGLKLTIHNCAGWSESGGPWVTPEQSMQKVVWSETFVRGGVHFSGILAQPETVRGTYRDIATLAFPTLPGDGGDASRLASTVTTSAGGDAQPLLTGGSSTIVNLPLPAGKPQYVQVAFREPATFASVRIACRGRDVPAAGRVEVSDDGTSWRTVAALPAFAGRGGSTAIASFPMTTAHMFRVTVTRADRAARRIALAGIAFGSQRIDQIAAKIGMVPNPRLTFTKGDWPAEMTIRRDRVIDLTARMQPGGRLDWEAPAGEWTIVRFGHTSTGQQNAPAPDSGRGLECDKMNRAAVEAHFAGMMAKVIADAGPLAGKSLKYVLADSWEAGTQNWTPAFREEFRKRMGYDLTPWLPAFTGRVVGSLDESERVLWDFRRVIADLIAENHYSVIRELCARHGMELTAEAPGIGMPTIADELQCKGRTDMPMGEFWLDGHNDSKEAATSAHVYGKRRASAEAFTAVTRDAKWTKAPYDHKAIGDLNFCRGINLFVFHRYAMQPWLDKFPGMTMGPWGTNFERTNTWWEQSRVWMQYLTRCQALLQDGLFVADACYYYGEGAPNTIVPERAQLTPPLPAGYDFDACGAEVLLTRMRVENGRIVLPDGMSYRVLVLPDTDRMSLPVVRKLHELVAEGAIVVGPRPERSPSLSGYPQSDDELRRVAAQIWGDVDGKTVFEHQLGRGKVVWGRPMERVLADAAAPPDVQVPEESRLVWIHRRVGNADVYFISNQDPFPTNATVVFRAGDRRPELWEPDSGQTVLAGRYRAADGRVSVPLHFEPAGSTFVVFRRPAGAADPAVTLKRDGRDLAIETSQPSGTLVVERAAYGVNPEQNQQSVDVTRQLSQAARNGRLRIQVDNNLAGDPALNVVKRLYIVYTVNGMRRQAVADENTFLELPTAADRGPETKPEPPAPVLALSGDRSYRLRVAEPGRYEVETNSGRKLEANVRDLPPAIVVQGPWNLRFPPKWGAPALVTLDNLASWTTHPEEGVKHFSGTATYTTDIDIPGRMLAGGMSVVLDLGSVREVAEVRLNGKDLGILWKPPYRVDISGPARPGLNRLEVRVTNLWPNRLIGDAALPVEKRHTFATFQPYKATDPLLDSGLLGPVTVIVEKTVLLR